MSFTVTTLNSTPKVICIPEFLEEYELRAGCRKSIHISRIGMYGVSENVTLNLIVEPNTDPGTIYVYNDMGDHIGGGVFKDVHLIVEKVQRGGPMEFFASPNSAPRNNAISTTMTQNIPISSNNACLPYFETLNVFNAWDYDVSIFTNGDVGIQLRCPACLLSSNTVRFSYTLSDGTAIILGARDVEAFGAVEYKERFFRPKIGSRLSGNVLLLIIADNKNQQFLSNDASYFCC